MEIIDLYDENGNKLDKTYLRVNLLCKDRHKKQIHKEKKTKSTK